MKPCERWCWTSKAWTRRLYSLTRIFRSKPSKPKAFRPPKDWSNRGQMSRIILSVLRQASEPLTMRDIALQLLVERALDKSDQRLLRLMTKRVGVALRGQRENG